MRSFQLEVQVEPKYHPKIIGRGGTVISRIRMNNDVQIQFPEKTSEQQDIIVVTGYQKNAEAAKEEILALVAELVCTVIFTVHPFYTVCLLPCYWAVSSLLAERYDYRSSVFG